MSYSYVGYQTVEKEINLNLLNKRENREINIKFEENSEIIAFYVTRKLPFHKRIWRGIKNIFYKNNVLQHEYKRYKSIL